jgi:hypothetical protein
MFKSDYLVEQDGKFIVVYRRDNNLDLMRYEGELSVPEGQAVLSFKLNDYAEPTGVIHLNGAKVRFTSWDQVKGELQKRNIECPLN